MAAPFFLQGNHRAEEVDLPLPVLRQGIVHDEQAVVVDTGHLRDHPVHRTGAELPSAEVTDAAGIAVEPAAPGGMDEIHHLDPLVIVEVPFEYRPPGGADDLRRRMVVEEVIHGLQAAVSPVVKDLFHPPFRLPEEDGIGVDHVSSAWSIVPIPPQITLIPLRR